MADKSIRDLNQATGVTSSDLFVLEQSGQAKKLTGQQLENWLVSFADGHGGIQSLVKTSSTGTNPVIDTYTITYADESTSTFTVTNGIKGDKGNQTYVWIKYAAQYPTADNQMGDSPDDWIGLYVGTASAAPTTRASYTWFQWKGDTGDPAVLADSGTEYAASTSGTIIPPAGTWYPEVPYVAQGNYLWTKTILNFNSGNPVTFYSVARSGYDGQGSPSTAVPLADNTSGDVGTSSNFAREDHRHPLPLASNILMTSGDSVQTTVATLQNVTANKALFFTSVPCTAQTGNFATLTNSAITANHIVVECVFDDPSAITTDVTWTTAAGSLTLNGTCTSATTAAITLIKKDN